MSSYVICFKCNTVNPYNNMKCKSCGSVDDVIHINKSYRDNLKAFDNVVLYGDSKLIEHLVKKGINLIHCDDESLIWAASEGRMGVVKYLCSLCGKDPSSKDNKAIIYASCNGHLPIIRYLCKRGSVDPSAQNNEAIIEAAMNGHLSVVKYLYSLLIERKLSLSIRDNLAIILSARYGHIEVVKYLCSFCHTDPSIPNNSAIRQAADNGHTEVVKYLMTRVVKMKEKEKREIKWISWSKSRLTDMYDGRDMREEVMVVREIMEWRIPHQMMDRLLEHLFKMKIYFYY